jgi:hypothetical protein
MDKSFLDFKPAYDNSFLTKLQQVLSENDVKFVEGTKTKAATGAHNPNPATEYTQMHPSLCSKNIDIAFANVSVTGTTPDEITTKKEVENEIVEDLRHGDEITSIINGVIARLQNPTPEAVYAELVKRQAKFEVKEGRKFTGFRPDQESVLKTQIGQALESHLKPRRF